MNTIAFLAAAVVLALVILAKIPGLEHTVRPVIDLVFSGLKVVLENLSSWVIWLFKSIWSAHIEVVKHLVLSASALDPSHDIREQSDE